ncbi:MAG TPA: UvrB/UvrC motif-containing protein [Terriglobales bacterium]|nr:UvrB/UvrC motif-containing protein [Terriglobales bacterium]
MVLMLPQRLTFDPQRDSEFFAEVPPRPAVFLLRGESGEPYVSKSSNLWRRVQRLLAQNEGISRRLNLRDRARVLEYQLTGSDFESGLLLYKILRAEFPKTYENRLRLRMAPLVRFHLENRYPRVSVTTKLGSAKSESIYYGPFPSRAAAEKFANDSLDFFKMRRCVEELNPDPAFPGCVYSEMKMCLAPCFKGCTDEEYADEVARVREFLDSSGQSLIREITLERDQASEDMHFETAALLHAKLEKLKPVVSQLPVIVQRIDRLVALMVQPSADPDSVTLFRINGGRFSLPVQLPLNLAQEAGGKPLSMEARIQEVLAEVEVPQASAQETMEQLAILKRWYYRTSKLGELFLADDRGDLPWRRIVRGVTRVFKGEKEVPDLSESAKDYWLFRAKVRD